MTHPQDTNHANPAQVTDALIQAKDWISDNIREGDIAGCTLLGKLAELTAAIGAGGQEVAFASRQSGILDFDVNGAEIINVLLHPKGTLRPENEIPVYAAPVPPVVGEDARHEFKNFHRLLCERFGYCHDEKDWQRDQISLIEHIAVLTSSAPMGFAALLKDVLSYLEGGYPGVTSGGQKNIDLRSRILAALPALSASSVAKPCGVKGADEDDGRQLAHRLADIARSLLSRPPELRGPFQTNEEALRRVAALPPKTAKPKIDVRQAIRDIEDGKSHGFLNDGTSDPTHDLNCPYCGGSGHKDDALSHPAQGWREIASAPNGQEVLIAYWRWRNSMSPGAIIVQSAMRTELHGPGIWSWVVSDNKHGPFPIRGWSDGDIIGWMPLPTAPAGGSDE